MPARRRRAALVRELKEELAVSVVPSEVARFTEFTFDFGFAGDGIRLRTYYAVTLPQADLDGLVLGEGADLAAFEAESLLAMPACGPVRRFRVMDAPCTRADCVVRPGGGAMRARMGSVPEEPEATLARSC